MEKSCHYYGLLALALMSGIKPAVARKIAYASQFVDDAKINKIVFDAEYDDALFESRDGKSVVYGIATCHSYFVISTFNYQSMINNTSAFHFFPGNNGDSFTQKMRCRKNPKVLVDLIGEVLSAVPLDPERLGMLLHTYADSFAHQGFSGLLSLENDIRDLETDEIRHFFRKAGHRIKKLFRRYEEEFTRDFIPAYGHGQVFTNPDVPFRKWSYSYDPTDTMEVRNASGFIDNRLRYRAAFDAMAAFLGKVSDADAYARPPAPIADADREAFYGIMFKREPLSSKIGRWREFIRGREGATALAYDQNEWLREAFGNFTEKMSARRMVDGASLVDGFREKSWYKYIASVIWYKKEILDRLRKESLPIPV